MYLSTEKAIDEIGSSTLYYIAKETRSWFKNYILGKIILCSYWKQLSDDKYNEKS